MGIGKQSRLVAGNKTNIDKHSVQTHTIATILCPKYLVYSFQLHNDSMDEWQKNRICNKTIKTLKWYAIYNSKTQSIHLFVTYTYCILLQLVSLIQKSTQLAKYEEQEQLIKLLSMLLVSRPVDLGKISILPYVRFINCRFHIFRSSASSFSS